VVRIVSNIAWQAAKAEHVGVWDFGSCWFRHIVFWLAEALRSGRGIRCASYSFTGRSAAGPARCAYEPRTTYLL
jgi:hypothetical protein